MAKAKKPLEAAQGRYFALPHNVLDSDAWKRTSPPARALLLELCRQHTGANNGALHLARAWIEARGWTRPMTVRRLMDELIQNRLVIQTRKGGMNAGSHQYAVTWLPISNFVGLSITARDFHPGAYLLPPLPPHAPRGKKITRSPYVLEKPHTRTPDVLDPKAPRTPAVREMAVLSDTPRTPAVHYEYNQSPGVEFSAADGCENAGGPFRTLAASGWEFTGHAISPDEQRRRMANIFRPRPATPAGIGQPTRRAKRSATTAVARLGGKA